MNTVGADQNITAGGFDMGAGAIEELRDDAALVLRECAKPATGVDGLRAQPFLDGAVDQLENTERDSLNAELDARYALMAGELKRLFAVLEAALKFSPAEA